MEVVLVVLFSTWVSQGDTLVLEMVDVSLITASCPFNANPLHKKDKGPK